MSYLFVLLIVGGIFLGCFFLFFFIEAGYIASFWVRDLKRPEGDLFFIKIFSKLFWEPETDKDYLIESCSIWFIIVLGGAILWPLSLGIILISIVLFSIRHYLRNQKQKKGN